jgi:hypothetical protein
MAAEADEFPRRPLDWNHKTCLSQIGLLMEGLEPPWGAWRTRPEDVEQSDSGTPHVCAAAEIIICRLAGPTWRIGSQLFGVAELSPAFCAEYFELSRSVCSIFTSFQSTSRSSAINMGNIVPTPWPISGFLAMIVTTPSGVMRMKRVCVVSLHWALVKASPSSSEGGAFRLASS